MAGEKTSLSTYAEFWPFYLSQHSKRASRLWHVAGTLLALLMLIMAIMHFKFSWLLIALALGYGFAWIAHVFVEKNRPATFTHPLWSLRGDFDMLRLWLAGELEAELVRRGIMT